MKKRRLSVAAIAVATVLPGLAAADEPYARLNVARSFADAEVTDTTDLAEATAALDLAGGALFGFAIGTDLNGGSRWGAFAWEGEFAYRDNSIDEVAIAGDVPGGFIDGADLASIETFALMGNVWWRPALFGKVRPYIGGGVGAAYLPSGGLSADDIYSLAYQYGGGVDYQFANGVRAGLGYRHFEISANDRDDSDPLFVFETRSEFSEDALYASASVPFAVFRGLTGADRGAASRRSPQQHAAFASDEERVREEAERRAEIAARHERRARERAEKEARREAKRAEKAANGQSSDKPGFLRRINPFARRGGSEPPPDADPGERGRDPFADIETATLAASLASAPAPSVKPRAAASPMNISLRSGEGASTAVGGGWFAQLGAYSSQGLARDMWRAKAARQPDVFAGAEHVVSRIAGEGGNSRLFALRVGPYDKAGAKALCALAAGDCVVVQETRQTGF